MTSLELHPFGERVDADMLCSLYHEWFNDSIVNRYLYPNLPKTKNEIMSWIKCIESNPDQNYFHIISNYKVIGHTGIKTLGTSYAEISIVIGEKGYWNKGYATTATSQLLHIQQKNAQTRQYFAFIHRENSASHKLFTNIGFTSINACHIYKSFTGYMCASKLLHL